MYFSNIPQNFGLAPEQDPNQLMQRPVLGYNQGIGGIQPQQRNEYQPAPQLGNLGGASATTSGLGGKSITPLMPYSKKGPGQTMRGGGEVSATEPGYLDYLATVARNAADKATFGTAKYGMAAGDYSYDALMDMMGYESEADYFRSLAEHENALKEGEEQMPTAALVGDVIGYAAPYFAIGPAEAALSGLGALSNYGTKAVSLAHLARRSMGYAGGGIVKQNLAKGGVVAGGIAALRGQHPDPRSALDAYDRTFGPDATAELMRSYADGGVVSGPGSGVADLIPGSIDGREDVRIASGEYVIPAWAVATLGDGSTEAGARVLDAMVARLREEGSERIMGTEPIEPNEFIPA